MKTKLTKINIERSLTDENTLFMIEIYAKGNTIDEMEEILVSVRDKFIDEYEGYTSACHMEDVDDNEMLVSISYSDGGHLTLSEAKETIMGDWKKIKKIVNDEHPQGDN